MELGAIARSRASLAALLNVGIAASMMILRSAAFGILQGELLQGQK